MIKPFGQWSPKLRTIDPSVWILGLALLVRLDVSLRFEIEHGYDALNHFAYTDLLKTGVLPRVGATDLGRARYAAAHPPLYYLLAWGLESLGLGRAGGVLISLLAGGLRLWMGDRLMRRLSLPPHVRALANVIHGFIPFALRVDCFYSNESLATTLALGSVYLAILSRPVLCGLVLGAGLLTKATVVSAVPAVIIATVFTARGRPSLAPRAWARLISSGAISACILALWAVPNLKEHGTPYPGTYHPTIISEVKTHPHLFQKPILERHAPQWYFPRISYQELLWPYSQNRPTLFNATYLEAWGDYYNYLTPRDPRKYKANGKPVSLGVFVTLVGLVHLGLLFTLGLALGFGRALWSLRRGRCSSAHLALGAMGVSYLSVASYYAAWVPLDYHGAVKATYALGAVMIFSVWSAQGLQLLERPRWVRWAAGALIGLTLLGRSLWGVSFTTS